MSALPGPAGHRMPRPNVIVVAAWAILIAFIVIGALAPLLAPHPPNAQLLMMRLRPPGTEGYLLAPTSSAATCSRG